MQVNNDDLLMNFRRFTTKYNKSKTFIKKKMIEETWFKGPQGYNPTYKTRLWVNPHAANVGGIVRKALVQLVIVDSLLYILFLLIL